MLVNNRPDGEEPGQPLAGDIEAAAEQAGIAYRFVPIIRGIGPADVEAMQDALREAGDGKLLAFCRSGTRSALACALAQREEGASREEVEQRLTDAGFDPARSRICSRARIRSSVARRRDPRRAPSAGRPKSAPSNS